MKKCDILKSARDNWPSGRTWELEFIDEFLRLVATLIIDDEKEFDGPAAAEIVSFIHALLKDLLNMSSTRLARYKQTDEYAVAQVLTRMAQLNLITYFNSLMPPPESAAVGSPQG